jgi:hypothetical protein
MTAPLKADVTAADRLLKAAVRRAVEILRHNPRVCVLKPGGGWDVMPDLEPAAAVLRTAAHAADILLADDERPAKKAAARKGAS